MLARALLSRAAAGARPRTRSPPSNPAADDAPRRRGGQGRSAPSRPWRSGRRGRAARPAAEGRPSCSPAGWFRRALRYRRRTGRRPSALPVPAGRGFPCRSAWRCPSRLAGPPPIRDRRRRPACSPSSGRCLSPRRRRGGPGRARPRTPPASRARGPAWRGSPPRRSPAPARRALRPASSRAHSAREAHR